MSYDTIQANGQVIYTSNHGGTYENKLIDLTTGNGFLIVVDGHNDTVRNIGFEGTYRADSFMISITGSGTIDIENVYLGDGASQEGEDFTHGPGAIFYHNDASADVNFRDCTVRGYSNNGFYCSNSANGGDIRWERCFTVNCGVTHYRGASPGDEIHDCVGYNSNDERHGESSGTERFGRPVWAWEPGPIDIYNSHFKGPPRPGDGALIAFSDSQINMHSGAFEGTTSGPVSVASGVGSNPDLSPPDTVPLTAEAAASGESGGEPTDPDDEPESDRFVPGHHEDEYDHVVFFINNTDSTIEYELYVEANLAQNNIDSATWDESVVFNTTEHYESVAGSVPPDTSRSYFFDGELIAAWSSAEFSWSGLDRDSEWSFADERNEPPEEYQPDEPDESRFVPGHAEGDYENVVFLLNNTGSSIEYDLYVERNLVQNDIDSAEWDKSVTFVSHDEFERVTGEVPDGAAHSYFFDGELLAAWASAEFSWSGLNRDGSWSPADEPDEPDISRLVTVDVNAPGSVTAGDTAVFEATVSNHSAQDRDIDVELFFDDL